MGSFQCHCPDGFTLAENQRNCIGECVCVCVTMYVFTVHNAAREVAGCYRFESRSGKLRFFSLAALGVCTCIELLFMYIRMVEYMYLHIHVHVYCMTQPFYI